MPVSNELSYFARLFAKAEDTNLVRLLRAIRERDEGVLEQLLKKGGASLANTRHMYGWCALHVAAMQHNMRAVESLLKAGAKVDAPDLFSTPGEVAREKQHNPHDGTRI